MAQIIEFPAKRVRRSEAMDYISEIEWRAKIDRSYREAQAVEDSMARIRFICAHERELEAGLPDGCLTDNLPRIA